jgi:hypothetical protein
MNQPKYLVCDPDLMPEDRVNTLTKVIGTNMVFEC